MDRPDTAIGIFADCHGAEAAVTRLAKAGFSIRKLSVAGNGFQAEAKVTGFCSVDSQIRFWGTQGPFWSSFWDMFLGGTVLTIPVVGSVIILGRLAAMVVAVVESTVVVGGLSSLGAALHSLGISRGDIIRYESALKAGDILVLVHSSPAELVQACKILANAHPLEIDVHKAPQAPMTPKTSKAPDSLLHSCSPTVAAFHSM